MAARGSERQRQAGGPPALPDPRLRAFLAVEISADGRARLVARAAELARLGAAVRWVREDALHVTLKFLGAVRADTLVALRAALETPLAAVPPLDAVVRGLGVFPDWRRPRVVWAGVDCAPLTAVAAAVDAAAAPLGLARETRPFTAHVTLGRVRATRGWAPLEAALRARADEAFGNCPFTALIALRSDLRPDGAVYTKLWSIPFGA